MPKRRPKRSEETRLLNQALYDALTSTNRDKVTEGMMAVLDYLRVIGREDHLEPYLNGPWLYPLTDDDVKDLLTTVGGIPIFRSDFPHADRNNLDVRFLLKERLHLAVIRMFQAERRGK